MKKLLPLVCVAIAIVAVMIFVSAPKQRSQFPAPPEPPVIKTGVDLVELIKPSYLFTVRDLWSISDEELALQSQVVTALQHTMITAPKSQVSESGYRLCAHLRKIIDTHYTYRKRQQQNAKLNRTLEGAAEIVGKVNNDRRVFAEQCFLRKHHFQRIRSSAETIKNSGDERVREPSQNASAEPGKNEIPAHAAISAGRSDLARSN